jgi:hypothetical protein
VEEGDLAELLVGFESLVAVLSVLFVEILDIERLRSVVIVPEEVVLFDEEKPNARKKEPTIPSPRADEDVEEVAEEEEADEEEEGSFPEFRAVDGRISAQIAARNATSFIDSSIFVFLEAETS